MGSSALIRLASVLLPAVAPVATGRLAAFLAGAPPCRWGRGRRQARLGHVCCAWQAAARPRIHSTALLVRSVDPQW